MEKQFFTALTLLEFRELIADVVRSENNNNGYKEKEGLFKNKLISRQKAKELLGVSDPTIINWEKAGKIRSYRMGGKIFYNLEEIENYILNNYNRAEAETR